MPRKNLIRTDQYFYHVTTRSNNREWFSIPLEKVWDISIKSFLKAQKNNNAIISQFVLMSNHYHLLIRTPNADIDRFMFWFNKTFSDHLRVESKRINKVFGGHYNWSIITNEKYFLNVFRYIYQNPLRAGLTNRCQYYPYSTLYFTYHNLPYPFPFQPLTHLENDLSFINEEIKMEKLISIRKGLRRGRYSEPKLRATPQ